MAIAEPSVRDRNKLHRLLGLFTGPVNGVKVDLDLLQEPSPMVEASRLETEHRWGASSYSHNSRKRRTESGQVPVNSGDSRWLVGWVINEQT